MSDSSKPSIPYSSISKDGVNVISAFLNGKVYVVIKTDFPEYEELLIALDSGDVATAMSLVNKYEAARQFALGIPGLTVAANTEVQAEEVDVVYKFEDIRIDGEFHRYMEQIRNSGKPDALVKFFTLLSQNPHQQSRKYLFDFLNRHKIEIAPDGTILIYKGTARNGKSKSSGYGIVNGEVFENAYLDNAVGYHVAIPREKVDTNPNAHCSVGLHVGALSYADSFGDKLFLTKVNPADVVCVTNDNAYQKIRCTQYVVVGLLREANSRAFVDISDEMRNFDASKILAHTKTSLNKGDAVQEPTHKPTTESVKTAKPASGATATATANKVINVPAAKDKKQLVKALEVIEAVYMSRDSRISADNRQIIQKLLDKALKDKLIRGGDFKGVVVNRKYHLTALLDKIRKQ